MVAAKVFPLFLFCLVLSTQSAKHNTCKHFSSYFDIDGSDCYYNPDVFTSTPEIIKNHVGVFEEHTVITDDGYILTLFRIPKANPKGVVILQHPVTADSSIYVIQGRKSLAFLMYQQGYDVWLPNNRGTPYSNQHINLTSSNFSYWNFSFHEIGIYDYSSIIKYIKKKTDRSDIIFIGHSMATSSSLVYASLKPNEAKKSIKIFIEMSPIAYLQHVRSPEIFLAPFEPLIRRIFNALKIGSLFTNTSLEHYIKNVFIHLPFKRVVVIILSFFCGWTPDEFEPELLNIVLSHSPISYSVNIFFHYAQIVNAGGIFQNFDYGENQNTKMYGTISPPKYPLRNITVPVYLITSASDSMSTIKDSHVLYDNLPKQAKIYGKLDTIKLNHIDFHVGKSRIREVYSYIFKLLHEIL